MRWDNLFDDLEGQLEDGLSAEESGARAEEERLRRGRLVLRDRLQAMARAEPERPLRIRLGSGELLRVMPLTFGRDWLSGRIIDDAIRTTQIVVPIGAIAGIVLDPPTARFAEVEVVAEERGLTAKLGLAFMLRDLCRRRVPLELLTLAGGLQGTIDRVGRDHLDLALHEPGLPRRAAALTAIEIVSFAAILAVRV
ncbi:hypothetical protein [Naasia lichenicola]|uniref:Uncharacterized protein n=1 Tax=Naasia lichenicola TaxID=2565933 RepID=A0A4S4FNV5_9MICO|nr:hypothetical protein [Naasia lichenicola]THG30707.1 hypothetical protein E6C64_08690 [Naasia lichenicola]THG31944.1 hypothetical protein E6C64_07835 [Naasia lichenicola]